MSEREITVGGVKYRPGEQCWQVNDGYRWINVTEQDHHMLDRIATEIETTKTLIDERDEYHDRLAKAEEVIHKIESQSGRLFEVGLCRQYFNEVTR